MSGGSLYQEEEGMKRRADKLPWEYEAQWNAEGAGWLPTPSMLRSVVDDNQVVDQL